MSSLSYNFFLCVYGDSVNFETGAYAVIDFIKMWTIILNIDWQKFFQLLGLSVNATESLAMLAQLNPVPLCQRLEWDHCTTLEAEVWARTARHRQTSKQDLTPNIVEPKELDTWMSHFRMEAVRGTRWRNQSKLESDTNSRPTSQSLTGKTERQVIQTGGHDSRGSSQFSDRQAARNLRLYQKLCCYLEINCVYSFKSLFLKETECSPDRLYIWLPQDSYCILLNLALKFLTVKAIITVKICDFTLIHFLYLLLFYGLRKLKLVSSSKSHGARGDVHYANNTHIYLLI